MDSAKLEVICNWPIFIKKKEVQVFLSMVNSYTRFIVNYSTKACLLIDLTTDIPYT